MEHTYSGHSGVCCSVYSGHSGTCCSDSLAASIQIVRDTVDTIRHASLRNSVSALVTACLLCFISET